MFDQDADAHIEATIARYFTAADRTIHLDPGNILMIEGQHNDRLFYVRSGCLMGHIETAAGLRATTLRANAGDVVGVQSFFSPSHLSAQSIMAVEPTELSWVDRATWPEEAISIERALMPVIVYELLRRQQMVAEMAEQHLDEQDQIKRLERFSFLGQLAAGVAHELNNALTVLVRGTEWIGGAISDRVAKDQSTLREAYELGRSQGRSVSTAEARERLNDLKNSHGLVYAQARKLAQTGLTDAQLNDIKHLKKNVDTVLELWELGATLNDMQLASEQAEHVVTSMKNLGARGSKTGEPIDINDSIAVALRIMQNATKGIEMVERYGEIEPVTGNRGELVQVWSNLLKNAAEAMNGTGHIKPTKRITITTAMRRNRIVVTIDDTGPGIAEDVLPRIFEPSVTTKKTGLSFGLGLGLSIVQRHVTDYGGDVSVSNTDHGARFTVTLPTGAGS